MIRSLVACLVLLVACASFGQDYTPKSGETVLKLSIEGKGNIFISLYTKEAPKTTAQIIRLAKNGFYNGQRFARVVKSPRPFLVQIGDPDSKSGELDENGDGGSGRKVPYENSNHSNVEGAVGLATFGGDKDSGDSQFYMLLAPAKFLDGNYTVFGRIVEGMDVLKKIEKGDRLNSATILGGL